MVLHKAVFRSGAFHAASIFLLTSIILALVWSGCSIRRWMWDESADVHFVPDMENAWRWGSAAAKDGYFSLYDRVVAQHRDGNYGLDYVPLRLAVMTVWAKSRMAAEPGADRWRADYVFNAPLLRFNIAMELTTAAGVFALAYLWSFRSSGNHFLHSETFAIDRLSRHLNAAWFALLPFALAWINPASIVSAHGRPTWDVWIMPFYLWAIFCACLNRWFIAGVIVGVGAMFKGQQFIVAPVFVMWPLMRMRFSFRRHKMRTPTILPALSAAGRWVLGFALAMTVIASPWLVPGTPAAYLLLAAGVFFWPTLWLALRLAFKQLKSDEPKVLHAEPAAPPSFVHNLAFGIQSSLRWLIPISMILATWLCFAELGGSLAWAKVGLLYGADKFKMLEIGGASTLASILQNSYGWRGDQPAVRLPWLEVMLTVEQLLSTIFGVLLIVAAWALQSTEKRGRAFLPTVALPWLLYFAVAPRMHERYLLWGALAASLAAAQSPGMTLLAVFFTLCSTTMSLFQILHGGSLKFLADVSPTLGPNLRAFARGTYPGIGWAILLATLVWLYVCLFPRRLRNSQ